MQGNNQLFRYNDETYQIFNVVQFKCLEADAKARKLDFAVCNSGSKNQRWKWSESTNKEMLETWEKSGRPFDAQSHGYWE